MKKICKTCGAAYDEQDRYCKTCGHSFVEIDDSIKLICPICGKIGTSNEIYCPDCGEKRVYRRIADHQEPLMLEVDQPQEDQAETAVVETKHDEKYELITRMNHRITRFIPYIVAACLLLVAGKGGYMVWDMFFNRTALDLVSATEFTYTGETGNGEIKKYKTTVDYDHDNKKLKEFVSHVTYTITPAMNLSNGDTIVLKAEYDEKQAKALKLDITDEQSFQVTGLTKRFTDASEIKKSIIKDLKKSANKAIQADIVDQSTTYGITYDSLWFAKGDEHGQDSCVAVYKITATTRSFFGLFSNTDTYYVAEQLDQSLNVKYNTKKSHSWSFKELRSGYGTTVINTIDIEKTFDSGYTYSLIEQKESVVREDTQASQPSSSSESSENTWPETQTPEEPNYEY